MATTKQPHPAAIRMTSNMSLLPKVWRSANTEGIECHQHHQGEGEMQRYDDADLEQRVAGSGHVLLLTRQRRPCRTGSIPMRNRVVARAREAKAVHDAT